MPGGVCAVLDYEVDTMSEYVAEMAVRVVTPDATVSTAFRKFVAQVLTSTRLPSTTILLGMNYLAKRINAMKGQGPCETTEGQVWRYLTISLLLGSKFLDDNTFQNRSWSEVSGIAVTELNSLEFDWLQAMNWNLYVNLDMSKDYQAWLDNWREWQRSKKRPVVHTNRNKLATLVPAIDTEVARYGRSGYLPQSRFLPEQVADAGRFHSVKPPFLPYRSQDAPWTHNPWPAPLTPPDSGYGTPEYGMSATSSNAHYNDWFAQVTAQYASRYSQPPAHNSYYPHRHAPLVGQLPYTHGPWDHGVPECLCINCANPPKQSQYFLPHAYCQPVLG